MEDYKKKYENALEIARKINNGDGVPAPPDYTICEVIFPELKESEDEKIRKSIIDLVEKQMPKSENKKWMIAWLEKQGEKFIPEDIDEAALQYVDTCTIDGKITHDNVTEPYWNNHSMMNAYKAGWLEKQDQKKYEEELENAYKCADEVQYRRGYEDAKRELKKQGEKVDVIKNFNTEFERQISHLIASIINKEYEYTSDFVKWTANALLNYAKHEFESQGEQNNKHLYDVIIALWDLLDKIDTFSDLQIDDTNPDNPFKKIEYIAQERHKFVKSDGYNLYIQGEQITDFKQSKQKPAWSEEEKARIDKIIDVLDWAEEKGHIHYSDWEDYVCYVKSLKPQNT